MPKHLKSAVALIALTFSTPACAAKPAPWSDVLGRRASDYPTQWNMARLQPCSVSLVFGFQNGGLSHGVAGVNGAAHFNLLGAQ